MLVAFAALLSGCAPSAEESPQIGVAIGNLAPTLEGKRADGASYGRADQAGAQLVVFYRGGYCGLCRLRLEAMQRRLPEYAAMGVGLLAASAESPTAVAETVRSTGVTFPVVSVDSTTLARWGLRAGPASGTIPPLATYLLDAGGIVMQAHQGMFDDGVASDVALLALLEQHSRDD